MKAVVLGAAAGGGFGDVRQRGVILAPERLLLPDEQAVEILSLVDGKTGIGTVVDRVAAHHTQASREIIAKEVVAMLQDLADKSVLADG